MSHNDIVGHYQPDKLSPKSKIRVTVILLTQLTSTMECTNMIEMTISPQPVAFSEQRKIIRPYAEKILGNNASQTQIDDLTDEMMHAANHLAIGVPPGRKPGSRGPAPDYATDFAASDAISACQDLGITAGAWGEDEASQSKAAEVLASIQEICKSHINPDYRIRSPNKRYHLERGQKVKVTKY